MKFFFYLLPLFLGFSQAYSNLDLPAYSQEITTISRKSLQGMFGSSLDEQDRKIMKEASPSTIVRMERGEPLTIVDVIQLHRNGISDETILQYMKFTRTTYSLSQAQLKHLQHAGVSQKVIHYMIDTGR